MVLIGKVAECDAHSTHRVSAAWPLTSLVASTQAKAAMCNSRHMDSAHEPMCNRMLSAGDHNTDLCAQALEHGNEASSGLGLAYSELTGHLSDASTQFFQRWLTLVELEEAPLQGKRAEIWKMTGQIPLI